MSNLKARNRRTIILVEKTQKLSSTQTLISINIFISSHFNSFFTEFSAKRFRIDVFTFFTQILESVDFFNFFIHYDDSIDTQASNKAVETSGKYFENDENTMKMFEQREKEKNKAKLEHDVTSFTSIVCEMFIDMLHVKCFEIDEKIRCFEKFDDRNRNERSKFIVEYTFFSKFTSLRLSIFRFWSRHRDTLQYSRERIYYNQYFVWIQYAIFHKIVDENMKTWQFEICISCASFANTVVFEFCNDHEIMMYKCKCFKNRLYCFEECISNAKIKYSIFVFVEDIDHFKTTNQKSVIAFIYAKKQYFIEFNQIVSAF